MLMTVGVGNAFAAFTYPHYIYRHGEGLAFKWVQYNRSILYFVNDVLGNVNISFAKDIDADGHTAELVGGLATASNDLYYCYSPYTPAVCDEYERTALPVKFNEQVQQGNGDTGHLGINDHMVAHVTTDGANNALINYKHLGAVLRLEFQGLANGEVDEVQLALNGSGAKGFVAEAKVNVDEKSLTPVAYAQSMTLGLENTTVGENGELVAYLMVAPVNIMGQVMNVTVKSKGRTVATLKVRGGNVEAGKMYEISLPGKENEEGNKNKEVKENKKSEGNVRLCETAVAKLVMGDVIVNATGTLRAYAPDFVEAQVAQGEFECLSRLGDVDGNGKVTMIDAKIIMEAYVAGKTDTIDAETADVNGDGMITMADANVIMGICLGEKR